MTPATKKIVGLTATVVVLGIIALWHISHKPKNPLLDAADQGDPKAVRNVRNFDQFQQDRPDIATQTGMVKRGSEFFRTAAISLI